MQSGVVDYISLRSVGSQTEPDNTNTFANLKQPKINTRCVQHVVNDAVAVNTDEDDSTIAQTEYRKKLFHHFDSPKSNKLAIREVAITDTYPSVTEYGAVSDETVTESSSEGELSEEDMLIVPQIAYSNIRQDDNDIGRPRVSRVWSISGSAVLSALVRVLSVLYRAIRHSRTRTMLMIVWFIYSGLIVSSCPSFLPMITFYTLIFFMIIYVDVMMSQFL